jgi:hypothetical protein
MSIKQEVSWWRWKLRARRFPGRFDEWLKDPRRKQGDHELLLAAFLDSGGAALTKATEMSASVFGQYTFRDKPSSIGLQPGSQDYERALTELRRDGYTVLPWRLGDELTSLLTHHFEEPELTIRSDDQTLNGCRAHLSYEKPLAEKYEVPLSSILTSPDAVELMLDRGVLQFAQDYLGSVPQVDICTAWFSFPMNGVSAEAATMFHFDLDRTKWVKIFFFLTDVTPTTGAHMFLPETQRDNALPTSLRKRGYSRLTDHDVRSEFPEEHWKTISGSRGTILIEDTRGLHKGLPVLEGHRLVLQFQYSQNLFGHKSSIHGQQFPFEVQALSEFRSNYPIVLTNTIPKLSHEGST